MDAEPIIAATIRFVKEQLAGAEAGHDWFHIERVYRNAMTINAAEHGDLLTISLAALLHDIADSKFHDGDEELGPRVAGAFMAEAGVDATVALHVVQIIRNMSYKAGLVPLSFSSKEMEIVQDADRLDAIGAIGIARAFTYGGYKNRVLYDPAVPPKLNMSKEEYKAATNPTINHFYEKLLLLKDLMKTETGRNMAVQRHAFMEQYLEQFYGEWNGLR